MIISGCRAPLYGAPSTTSHSDIYLLSNLHYLGSPLGFLHVDF